MSYQKSDKASKLTVAVRLIELLQHATDKEISSFPMLEQLIANDKTYSLLSETLMSLATNKKTQIKTLNEMKTKIYDTMTKNKNPFVIQNKINDVNLGYINILVLPNELLWKISNFLLFKEIINSSFTNRRIFQIFYNENATRHLVNVPQLALYQTPINPLKVLSIHLNIPSKTSYASIYTMETFINQCNKITGITVNLVTCNTIYNEIRNQSSLERINLTLESSDINKVTSQKILACATLLEMTPKLKMINLHIPRAKFDLKPILTALERKPKLINVKGLCTEYLSQITYKNSTIKHYTGPLPCYITKLQHLFNYNPIITIDLTSSYEFKEYDKNFINVTQKQLNRIDKIIKHLRRTLKYLCCRETITCKQQMHFMSKIFDNIELTELDLYLYCYKNDYKDNSINVFKNIGKQKIQLLVINPKHHYEIVHKTNMYKLLINALSYIGTHDFKIKNIVIYNIIALAEKTNNLNEQFYNSFQDFLVRIFKSQHSQNLKWIITTKYQILTNQFTDLIEKFYQRAKTYSMNSLEISHLSLRLDCNKISIKKITTIIKYLHKLDIKQMKINLTFNIFCSRINSFYHNNQIEELIEEELMLYDHGITQRQVTHPIVQFKQTHLLKLSLTECNFCT